MFNDNKQRISSSVQSNYFQSRPDEHMPTFINSSSPDIRERVCSSHAQNKHNEAIIQTQQQPNRSFTGQSVMMPNKQNQPIRTKNKSNSRNCEANNFNSKGNQMVNTMPNTAQDQIQHYPNEIEGQMFKTIDPVQQGYYPQNNGHCPHGYFVQSNPENHYSQMVSQHQNHNPAAYYRPKPIPGYYHQYIDQFGQLVQIYPNPQIASQIQTSNSNFQPPLQHMYQHQNVQSYSIPSTMTEGLPTKNEENISHEFIISSCINTRNENHVDPQAMMQLQSGSPNQQVQTITIQESESSSRHTSIEAKSMNPDSNVKNGIISINSKKTSLLYERHQNQQNLQEPRRSSMNSINSKNSMNQNKQIINSTRSQGQKYPCGKNYMALHQAKIKQQTYVRAIPRKSTSPQSPNFSRRSGCQSKNCSATKQNQSVIYRQKLNQTKSPRYAVKLKNNNDVEVHRNHSQDYQQMPTSKVQQTTASNSEQTIAAAEESIDQFSNQLISMPQGQQQTYNPRFVNQAPLYPQQKEYNPQNQVQINQYAQQQQSMNGDANTGNFGSITVSPPQDSQMYLNPYVQVPKQYSYQHDISNSNCATSFEQAIEPNANSQFIDMTSTQDYYCGLETFPNHIHGQSTSGSEPRNNKSSKFVIKMDQLKDNLKQRQLQNYKEKYRHVPRDQESSITTQQATIETVIRPDVKKIHTQGHSRGMSKEFNNINEAGTSFNQFFGDASCSTNIACDPKSSMTASLVRNKSKNLSKNPTNKSSTFGTPAKDYKKHVKTTSSSNLNELNLLHQMQHEIMNLKQTNLQLIDQVHCLKSNQDSQKMTILNNIQKKDINILNLQEKVFDMECQLSEERQMSMPLSKRNRNKQLSGRFGTKTQQSPSSQFKNNDVMIFKSPPELYNYTNGYIENQQTSESDRNQYINVNNEMQILEQSKIDLQSQLEQQECEDYKNHYIYQQNCENGFPTRAMSTLEQAEHPQQQYIENNLRQVQNQSIVSYSVISNGTKQFNQGILTKSPTSAKMDRHVKIQTSESQDSNRKSSMTKKMGVSLKSFINQKSPTNSAVGSTKKKIEIKQYNNISNINPKKAMARFQPSKLAVNNYQQKTQINCDLVSDKTRSVSCGRKKSNRSQKNPINFFQVRESSQNAHITRIREARQREDVTSIKSFADIVRNNIDEKSPRRQVSARVSTDKKNLCGKNATTKRTAEGISARQSFDLVSKLPDGLNRRQSNNFQTHVKDVSEDRKYKNIISKSQKVSARPSDRTRFLNRNSNNILKSILHQKHGSPVRSPSPIKLSPVPMKQNPKDNFVWKETSPRLKVYKSLREQGSLSSKKPNPVKVRQLTPKCMATVKSYNPSETLKTNGDIPEKMHKFNPLSLKTVNIVSNETNESNLFLYPKMSAQTPVLDNKRDPSRSSFQGSFQNYSKKSVNNSNMSSCQKNMLYKQFINGENNNQNEEVNQEEIIIQTMQSNKIDKKILQPSNQSRGDSTNRWGQQRSNSKNAPLEVSESLGTTATKIQTLQPKENKSIVQGSFKRHKENLSKTNREIENINRSTIQKNQEKMKTIKLQLSNQQSRSSGRNQLMTTKQESVVSNHEERRRQKLQSWQSQINEKVQQKDEKRMNLLLTKKLQNERNHGISRIR